MILYVKSCTGNIRDHVYIVTIYIYIICAPLEILKHEK